MRRWAFVVTVLGMFVLSLFLSFGEKKVESLEGLELNQRVSVSGKVVDERVIFESTKLLVLDSDIELICEGCLGVFDGRKVSAVGVVSEFEGKKQVEVLKIVG